MLSAPVSARSIATKLVLHFTVAAALLLTLSLGICYWLVVRHAIEEDNAGLADKIAAVKHDLRAGGPENLSFQPAANVAGERSVYFVRVLDAAGRVVNETPEMGALLPSNVFPSAAEDDTTIVKPHAYHVNSRFFSLVSTAEHAGNTHYIIQLAQDRSVDAAFQKEFGVLFFTVLTASILASVIVARTATRRGLQPLARLTDSVRRIRPGPLHERLAPKPWPTELQPLAAAFDQMLTRLEQSFVRLSQFSADIAHELRTPIANILGEAQVTLTRERAPSDYREVIASIAAECDRLSLIVDNLLFLARAESAREQIARQEFDGRRAVEKMVTYYGAIAEERGVIISCEGNSEITADPVLFERALSNLIENALRFTGSGGKLTISLRSDQAGAQVSVVDTGTGIPPEHLPKIFDRFYRADPSRSSEGSGLGLALVKSITDLHGGSVKVSSRPNEGTTVVLTFPFA